MAPVCGQRMSGGAPALPSRKVGGAQPLTVLAALPFDVFNTCSTSDQLARVRGRIWRRRGCRVSCLLVRGTLRALDSESRVLSLSPGPAVRPLASALPFLSLRLTLRRQSLGHAALGGASLAQGSGQLLGPLWPPVPTSCLPSCRPARLSRDDQPANLFTELADPFRELGPSFPELGY